MVAIYCCDVSSFLEEDVEVKGGDAYRVDKNHEGCVRRIPLMIRCVAIDADRFCASMLEIWVGEILKLIISSTHL